MPYLLAYPFEISTRNLTKTIELTDIIKRPLLCIFPNFDKINYPVYLKVCIDKLCKSTSLHALLHSRSSGVCRVECWVDAVRKCLREEGFRETAFHTTKGEMLSMYRRIGKLDIHVRILKDGKVFSEIEPSRYTVSHITTFLFPTVLPCLYEVKTVFDKHNIPYKIMHEGEECKILSNRLYFLPTD